MLLTKYFQTVWQRKFVILILMVLFGAVGWFGTTLRFEPYWQGEAQFTVQLLGDAQADAQNSDWFASTVQGWLESASLREKIQVDYSTKKTSWQNLTVTISDTDEEMVRDDVERILVQLDEQVKNYNSWGGQLALTNLNFTSWPVVATPDRNTAFGVLLGLVLGVLVALALGAKKKSKKK